MRMHPAHGTRRLFEPSTSGEVMRKPITTAILAALVGSGGLLAPSTDVLATNSTVAYTKVIAAKGVFGAKQSGTQLVQDYGSFALYKVSAAALAAAQAAGQSVQVDPEADVLQFNLQPFNTQQGSPSAPAPFSLQTASGAGLQVVQFVGPVKNEWLDTLSSLGITPVQYVPSNGYIVYADSAAQARLAQLRSSAAWLQYASPVYSFWKVDGLLQSRLAANAASSDEVDVTVQIYAHAGDAACA
jgi:hypothetical protein